MVYEWQVASTLCRTGVIGSNVPRSDCPPSRPHPLQCHNGHNGHGINLYGVHMILISTMHTWGGGAFWAGDSQSYYTGTIINNTPVVIAEYIVEMNAPRSPINKQHGWFMCWYWRMAEPWGDRWQLHGAPFDRCGWQMMKINRIRSIQLIWCSEKSYLIPAEHQKLEYIFDTLQNVHADNRP